MTPTPAGEYRHYGVFQEEVLSAANNRGKKTQSWNDFSRAWVSIEQLGQREFQFAQTFKSTANYKLKCRYIPGLKTTFRFLYGSRAFEINGINNVEERNIELILYCTEVKP